VRKSALWFLLTATINIKLKEEPRKGIWYQFSPTSRCWSRDEAILLLLATLLSNQLSMTVCLLGQWHTYATMPELYGIYLIFIYFYECPM
jgi:hypothetical protein